jgi:hypothetical protein
MRKRLPRTQALCCSIARVAFVWDAWINFNFPLIFRLRLVSVFVHEIDGPRFAMTDDML